MLIACYVRACRYDIILGRHRRVPSAVVFLQNFTLTLCTPHLSPPNDVRVCMNTICIVYGLHVGCS